jgi:hypothetical protein
LLLLSDIDLHLEDGSEDESTFFPPETQQTSNLSGREALVLREQQPRNSHHFNMARESTAEKSALSRKAREEQERKKLERKRKLDKRAAEVAAAKAAKAAMTPGNPGSAAPRFGSPEAQIAALQAQLLQLSAQKAASASENGGIGSGSLTNSSQATVSDAPEYSGFAQDYSPFARNPMVDMTALQQHQPRRSRQRGMGFSKMAVNNEVMGKVKDLTQSHIWPMYKFLSNEAQIDEVALIVLRKIPEMAHHEHETNGLRTFSDMYGTTICTTINNNRTNAMSYLRKAYTAYGKEGGNKVPTLVQLREVICRKGMDLDEEDPQKNAQAVQYRHWFQWYWETLLPKVTGKYAWGQGIRTSGTICEHKDPDTGKKYISSSDEAMVLLCMENGEQRFKYCLECELKGEKADQHDEQYGTRWSSSSAGQNKFGGWTQKGRTRFIELCKKISKAKKKPHVKDLEESILRQIREDANMKVDPTDKSVLGPMEFAEDTYGYVGVWEGSDEETEGEGEESDIEDLDDSFLKPKARSGKGKKKSKEDKKAAEKSSDDEESEHDE